MPIVEPAHMELAEPSIATAFARCVERGATTVVVFPYFLLARSALERRHSAAGRGGGRRIIRAFAIW